VIISKPTPTYTDQALKKSVSGTVVLSLVLSASGEVSDIRVVEGIGHGLDEEAIRVAKLIRFLPAEFDGQVASQRIKVEYDFRA
jgi:TonB family protein